MKFLGSSQLSFGFYYYEYFNTPVKFCHFTLCLICQIVQKFVEHHGLLAEFPCRISTSSVFPQKKLVTYFTLYFVSCVNVGTIPLILCQFTFSQVVLVKDFA